MNEKIKQLALDAGIGFTLWDDSGREMIDNYTPEEYLAKFAELLVRECINREELLGAIARGWCSEKNSHKTMDPDLALAIFDEVERQIKQHFGVEE
jgi:hypothetical protein